MSFSHRNRCLLYLILSFLILESSTLIPTLTEISFLSSGLLSTFISLLFSLLLLDIFPLSAKASTVLLSTLGLFLPLVCICHLLLIATCYLSDAIVACRTDSK